MHIQLGDIIQLGDDPTYRFVEYVDDEQIRLLTPERKGSNLFINPDGSLKDVSIQRIKLISRAETPGYATQNGLKPGVWVEVKFGWDIPMIVTGEITNLEHDQIELKLVERNKTIYIDFGYKGLPIEMNIEYIRTREPVVSEEQIDDAPPMEEVKWGDEESPSVDLPYDEELYHEATVEEEETLGGDPIFLDADKLELAPQITITHVVDVPESQQRYGVEAQVNDMLDDFLSGVPNHERTDAVYSRIHRDIERYKQLRTRFIDGPPHHGVEHRPLLQTLKKLDTKLQWLIPVVQLRKRVFDTGIQDEGAGEDIHAATLESEWQTYEEGGRSANGYKERLSILNEFATPFIAPLRPTIHSQKVSTSLTAVVHNMDDFGCSAVNKEKLVNRRFFDQVFVEGLHCLETYKNEQRAVRTENETIHIHSFLSLPESATHFSRVSLPGSSIMTRSDLSSTYLAYGRILHRGTNVHRMLVEKPNTQAAFRHVTNYLPEEGADYDEYLRRIVPPSESLIHRYKGGATTGDLSFHAATRTLEPFMVYTEDICEEHMRVLQKYVGEKIRETKRAYSTHLETIAFLSTTSMPYETRLAALTNGVSEKYGLGGRSDGERWSQVTCVDEGRLLATSMALESVDLMISEGLLQFDETNTPLRGEKVIAKDYASRPSLEKDNGVEIYFDKKRDPTDYDIASVYQAEFANVPDVEKVDFLSTKLQEVNGLNKIAADRDANAMLSGRRAVEEGEYALLSDVHYRRTGGQWVVESKDEPTAPKMPDFDERLRENKEEMTRLIESEHKRATDRVDTLRRIRNNRKYRYEKGKSGVAGALDVSTSEVSPYESLRDVVLGEEDFVKRQHYLVKFVDQFTRPANPDEPVGWFYCVQTDLPLVPTFMRRLADAFLNKEDYLSAVKLVCYEQGKQSDDESSWVDKFTGYPIAPLAFNTQEGYTEDGFRVVSRDIIAKEAGALQKDKTPVLTMEGSIITSVVSAMTSFLGIDIGTSMDFIVQRTAKMLNAEMPSRSNYAKAVAVAEKKGKKKIDSYEKKLNQTAIMYSLAYLLVAIQTNVPPVRTQKRHPGCTKSFAGYPLGEENDKSGLKYLVCVARSIRSKVDPWDSIYSLKQETLLEKVTKVLETKVVPTLDVQNRLSAKRADLKVNPEKVVAEREGLVRWTTFRPSLVPVNVGTVENVSDDFTRRLKDALKNGRKDQFDLLGAIQTKNANYAMKIQQLIEEVIKDGDPALTSGVGAPYLENACCHEGVANTFAYFAEKAPDIVKHNKSAATLETIFLQVERLARPSILYDSSNTKHARPTLVEGYSEATIYRAFIHYCKYHNQLPISEDIRAICSEKPSEFDSADTFEEQIRKLKRDGYNYNDESLQQLMHVVYKRNTLAPIRPAAQTEAMSVDIISDLIERNVAVPEPFTERFNAFVQNASEGEGRNLKNYLGNANATMAGELQKFCNRYNVDSTLLECHDVAHCVPYLTRLFPNIIANKVDYSEVDPPKYWKLSSQHRKDYQKFINVHYQQFCKLYENADVLEILAQVRGTMVDFATLWAHAAVHDDRLEKLLRQFYFYIVLMEHIQPTTDKVVFMPDEDEVPDGNIETREQSVALIFRTYTHVLLSERTTLRYTYETLMERVHRAKEKEKDMMTEYLRDMTDEQREIENIHKNSRLGKWNKGLQRGLREYQGDTYDEERAEMEKHAIAELKAGEKNMITGMNRDIYAMDHIEEEQTSQQIEAEEMRLHLPEDDDFGEMDGDEHF